MKTRNYLALMVAFILVPALISAGWGLSLLLQKEREGQLKLVEAKAAAIALDIDQKIADMEGALRVLSYTNHMRTGDLASLYELMKNVNKDPDSYTVLYGHDGRVMMSTLVPFSTSLRNISYEWVPEAIARQKVTVSNLRLGKVSNAPVVSVNMPVVTDSGAQYLMSQVITPKHLNMLLSAHANPSSWVLGIVGSDGISIARNRNAAALVGKPVAAALQQAMQERYSGRITNLSRDNIPVYSIFTRTERTNWAVAIGVPEAEIEAPARRAAAYGALAAVLVFGLAALALFLLARRLTGAFNDAVEAADVLGHGGVPEMKPSSVQEAYALQTALHHAGSRLAAESMNRKALEQEREILLCKEQEARRLAEDQNAAKDDFLAMLAHELRNPLAPISAAAQLLKLAGPDDKTVRRASDIIERQVDHLTELVDDLLDVSRVTRGLVELEKNRVDIKSVLGDAVEQARPLIESRQHRLNIRMDAGHALVFGDRTRLIQVVTNLLNNAAKYTPQGGEILLAIDVTPDRVRISVTDNGMGIEPSLLPHVFDLFRQGKRTPDRSQGGLGLGLALVKSIMALHGGRVEAHSDGLGKGSTFSLVLPPYDSGDVANLEASNSGTVKHPVKATQLLIVDDNADGARSLASLLEAKGHQVRVATTAQSALAAAKEKAAPLYILDIGLPDMDGYELARRLRAQPENQNAVMVALTGYGQAHDKVLSMAAGFNYHFVKPLDLARLDSILADLAERAMLPD
ncbi:hybrid sensor histidine kinase/response regulator [Noviherbaspirillum aerium]|uniref:hybrid sensor histidine kinase/response regulator n=1 Tax=Noviherbaspirillum aerium TaxID=2588497 RepID=UPI00124C0949|nr:ATP-binding protein [Noviherbaspirillum aerium]